MSSPLRKKKTYLFVEIIEQYGLIYIFIFVFIFFLYIYCRVYLIIYAILP